MKYIYIPAKDATDWAQLLSDPEKHWRTGYSARTLAYSWQSADGFPPEIQEAFSQNELLNDIQLLLAIPEHQVRLEVPGHHRMIYGHWRGQVQDWYQ